MPSTSKRARGNKPPVGKKVTDRSDNSKRKKTDPRERDGAEKGSQYNSKLIYSKERALKQLLCQYPGQGEDDNTLESIKAELIKAKNARVKNQQISVRICPSKKNCRFELPMDLRELETLSPQEYLRRFCVVCRRRVRLYKNFFEKFDRDRDGLLTFKLKNLTSLSDAENRSHFDLKDFSAIGALSERLFYSSFLTEDMEQGDDGEKDFLEEADFCSLLSKLRSYNVSPSLTSLLKNV